MPKSVPALIAALLLASACGPRRTEDDSSGVVVVTSVKGGRVIDEGGGAACGAEAAQHVADLWDSLPAPAGAALYTRVEVALVTRQWGSVTDWFGNPIRIEIASYSRCETIDLVFIHEIGHALRALYLGTQDQFAASETSPQVAGARAQQWATLLGYGSWQEVEPVAEASCGLADDHCYLPTEELFAETIRGFLYRPGDATSVWCEGPTPCWIYGFYETFPDPRAIEGFEDWLDELTRADCAVDERGDPLCDPGMDDSSD